jgi:hypothetical protein
MPMRRDAWQGQTYDASKDKKHLTGINKEESIVFIGKIYFPPAFNDSRKLEGGLRLNQNHAGITHWTSSNSYTLELKLL